ncbi:MAG: DEAD/DEAH box helicase [Pseudomonadota bacterium]
MTAIPSQFDALGLSKPLLKSIAKLGFDEPTPIQTQAIPFVLEGRDLLGLAQTGTGKTAAFGLPLLQHLMADPERPAPKCVRALILSPTRELVNQIADNIRSYTGGAPLRIARVVGGASINLQSQKLAKGVDVLVATPGRLLDLVERRAVFLDTAKFLILDEADQMLDLGFIHALRKIEKLVGQPRQTLLFSATMPTKIEALGREYLNNPARVEVAPAGKAADKVRQTVHFVEQSEKADLLKQCLAERPDDLSLVFARTKHGAEKLMKGLVKAGFKAASIHGNKSQGQRERAIKAFRQGEIRVLVATDVAARGIDIPGVSHVYNYELPEVAESYVHRIGRTARAGAHGEAVAFCAPVEQKLLRDIQKLMGIKVEVASGEPAAVEPAPPKRGGGGGRHGRNQGGRDDGARKHGRGGQAARNPGGRKPAPKPNSARPESAQRKAAHAEHPGGGRPKHGRPGKWRRARKAKAVNA